jgi:RNA polymerase sigma-70 factor (ECF subfamily)
VVRPDLVSASPLRADGAASSEVDFDRFFRDHGSRLLGQAYVLVGDPTSAQDLVQESFLKAWQHWQHVRQLDCPEAWVRRVLYNLAVSQWRKNRRLVPLSGFDLSIPGPHPDAMALSAALRTLPRRQAQALVLHDAAGLSALEVARELGVPEGTVRSWLSRGRARVAARMVEAEDSKEGAP